MRKKVEKMEIYIEANLISNLVIGDIHGLPEYHIDTPSPWCYTGTRGNFLHYIVE